MRITDTDDDYTVTADQRAALMELENLTWNYPTPGQTRSAVGQGDDEDTDEDDDDDSYYVDMAPYDMTERLKEVNRALLEDPTPAESDRAITVRFRDVIADYQSPREYYPSDSDDGYGDSSDILYDAEEEDEGLTSLTSEVKETLGGNVNVVDLMSDFVSDTCDFKNARNGLANSKGLEHDILQGFTTFEPSDNSILIGGEKQSDARKRDVPRLNLGNNLDEVHSKGKASSEKSFSTLPSEETLLKLDDSGLGDLETFMKENESSTFGRENGSAGDSARGKSDIQVKSGSMSLVEISDRLHVEKGFSSLGDGVDETFEAEEVPEALEGESESLFERRSKESPRSHEHTTSKSGPDFSCYEYEDDFEDVQEEESSTRDTEEDEAKPSAPPVAAQTPSPRRERIERPKEASSKPQARVTTPESPQRKSSQEGKGHKSRKDQSATKKSPSPSGERSKRRVESPSEASKSPSGRTKLKRSSACPPTIKPALLSSEKLGSIRSEGGRHKTSSSSSRSSLFPSSSTFSSSSSSSSASSSSSSASSPPSSSTSTRGRTRTPISGPVRPTQNKSSRSPSSGSRSGTSRSEGNVPRSSSPVKVPSTAHQSLSLTPITPTAPTSVRTAPQHRVRKAASASDLHRVAATEETEDRKKQNEAVFKAWLQRKNKEAAIAKKQSSKSSCGRSGTDVVERRAKAEEAFQAWLSKKKEQLKLEKKMRGERRRLEDQSRYARTKAECEVAYKEWCRRKRDEMRTVRVGVGVPRSQSLERPWVQEKTRKLYSAYLNGN